MTLSVGSLCAGIGGIELGLEMTGGFRTAWQAEIDPYALRVLAKHWPDAQRLEDVRHVSRDTVPRVDLITAGFPCQPFSQSGLRLGEQDARHLWPEIERIVGDLRPRWFLGENVPGLLTIDRGRTFGRILADLGALGYDAEWECLPAAAFGAPHRRDRLFIVAYPQRTGPPVGVFGRAGPPAVLAAPHTRSAFGYEYGALWDGEPDLAALVHGIPAELDGATALGNAVVPQVARWIGEQILAAGAGA